MRTLPAHDLRRAFEELQPHVARHVALRLRDECVEGVAKWAEPQAVIDHLRPLLRDKVFEPRDLLRQGDVFESLVSLQEEDGSGCLVDLARFDADEPVLEMIDPADAAFASHLVQRSYELESGGPDAPQQDRDPLPERALKAGGLGRAPARRAPPPADLLFPPRPPVLPDPPLPPPAPHRPT